MSELTPIAVNPVQRLHEMQQISQTQELQPKDLAPPVVSDSNQVNVNTKFSSYSAFAKAYPKMNKAMMMSLAQSVLTDMRRHEATMKRLARESRQN